MDELTDFPERFQLDPDTENHVRTLVRRHGAEVLASYLEEIEVFADLEPVLRLMYAAHELGDLEATLRESNRVDARRAGLKGGEL